MYKSRENNLLVMLLSICVIAIVPLGYWAFYSETSGSVFLPAPISVFLLAGALIISRRITTQYCRWTIYIWCAWYFFGLLSYYASSELGLSWTKSQIPTVEPFTTIYAALTLSAAIGALCMDFVIPMKSAQSEARLNVTISPAIVVLAAFPVLYLISMYLSYGIPPVLTGKNYYIDLYHLNFGPLYPFSIITSTAAIALYFLLLRNGQRLARKSVLTALFCVALFANVAEGKRLSLTITAIIIIFHLASTVPSKKKAVVIAIGTLVAPCVAILLHLARTGFSQGEAGLTALGLMSTLGVEFRDSIMVVANYSADTVGSIGYDWLASTSASVANSSVLEALGIDKDAVVRQDSARTFMVLLDQQFGIRLGIMTELWFAFGVASVIPMGLFGMALLALARRAENEENFVRKVFWLTLLGNWAVAMMGQSTVIFGAIPTLLYAYFAVTLIEMIAPGRGNGGQAIEG